MQKENDSSCDCENKKNQDRSCACRSNCCSSESKPSESLENRKSRLENELKDVLEQLAK